MEPDLIARLDALSEKATQTTSLQVPSDADSSVWETRELADGNAVEEFKTALVNAWRGELRERLVERYALEIALRDLLDFARRRLPVGHIPPQGQRAIDLLAAIDAEKEHP